jgi:retron-type reverse transcriptase
MNRTGPQESEPGIPKYEDVYCFSSLLAAFRKARRAKRGKGSEPAFYFDLESNLLTLSRELLARSYTPDPYRYFHLRKTKERLVSEASFPDRVVHHALVGTLEPTFERQFINNSYACRKGKGTHLAIADAHRLTRQFRYFLKLDFRKYFNCINHTILLRLLAMHIKDEGILWLCHRLMANAIVPDVDPTKGCGLPIGNLTSQFWANVYLNPLDHHCLRLDSVGAYLRYMDDMLLFADNKAALWAAHKEVERFSSEGLLLELKHEVTRVAPVTEGIPWLGFRVFPGTIRLDHQSKTRFIRNLNACCTRAEAGLLSDEAEVARATSLCGHVGHANTLHLRRSVLQDGPWHPRRTS